MFESVSSRVSDIFSLIVTCYSISNCLIYASISKLSLFLLLRLHRWRLRGEAAPVLHRPGLEQPAETESRVHPPAGVRGWHQLLRQYVSHFLQMFDSCLKVIRSHRDQYTIGSVYLCVSPFWSVPPPGFRGGRRHQRWRTRGDTTVLLLLASLQQGATSYIYTSHAAILINITDCFFSLWANTINWINKTLRVGL